MYHVPLIALISAKRWRRDVLTFFIHGFGIQCCSETLTKEERNLKVFFLVMSVRKDLLQFQNTAAFSLVGIQIFIDLVSDDMMRKKETFKLGTSFTLSLYKCLVTFK